MQHQYYSTFLSYIFAKSVNWEENRELGVVRLHIFNSRISNSRKIPGPKNRELGGNIVYGVSICIQSIDTEEKLPSIFEREKN